MWCRCRKFYHLVAVTKAFIPYHLRGKSSSIFFALAIAIIAAERKLPLAHARVLLIASRANAKSLHVLWPIRTPRPSCANQDAWAVLTPKQPKANSDTRRRVTFTNHAQGCTISKTSFRPHYLFLPSVPFSLGVRQRVTLRSSTLLKLAFNTCTAS